MRICLITEGERPLSAGTEGFLRSLGDLSGTERSWILFALTERTAELVSPAGAEAVCTLPLLEAAPPDGSTGHAVFSPGSARHSSFPPAHSHSRITSIVSQA